MDIAKWFAKTMGPKTNTFGKAAVAKARAVPLDRWAWDTDECLALRYPAFAAQLDSGVTAVIDVYGDSYYDGHGSQHYYTVRLRLSVDGKGLSEEVKESFIDLPYTDGGGNRGAGDRRRDSHMSECSGLCELHKRLLGQRFRRLKPKWDAAKAAKEVAKREAEALSRAEAKRRQDDTLRRL